MNSPRSNRMTMAFVLASTFITFAGIGITNPILPFITSEYAAPQDSALVIGLLTASFSVFQFLAVPALGALSDRYGRRPILLISLLGSAAGYFIFGIGGALWVLFLGRIIDGLTGGNVAAVQAYVADVTHEKDRTRIFGMVGAISGLGFVIGPALGAAAFKLTNSAVAPVYLAGVLTLLITVWGYLVMRESLLPENRNMAITVTRINPLGHLLDVFRMPQIRALLVAIFLWGTAYAFLAGNLSYLTDNRLGWQPDQTSLLFFVGGVFTVVTQAALIKRLQPRLGETRLAVIGLGIMIASYGLITQATATGEGALLFAALAVGGIGVGLINPALSGLLSQGVSAKEQGRVQGASQSLQALARVIGPIWGGWVYQQFSAGAPYLSGMALMLLTTLIVASASSALKTYHRAAFQHSATE